MVLRAWLAGLAAAGAGLGQLAELGPPAAAGSRAAAPPPTLVESATPAGPMADSAPLAWSPRARFAHFSRGPGVEDHYSATGIAVPLHVAAGPAPGLLFAEGAALQSDRGLPGGSAGLVYRAVAPNLREAQGYGVWLDGRDLGPTTFRRIGLSWDSLAPADETRLNLYFPFGSAHARLPDEPTTATFGSATLAATREQRYSALHQVEIERGGLALGDPAGFGLWGFFGGYHAQGAQAPQIWGVTLRGELRFGGRCGLFAQFQADRFFGARGFFGAEVQFPGTRPRGRGGDLDLPDLLFRPVGRGSAVAAARPSELRFP